MRPSIVAKNPKAWIKNPATVGTPAVVIIGTSLPRILCIIRKVSGLANMKKTKVL